ncbi:sugar isomerase, KpsF/GutQ [Aspergillus clavatus NRRL 1]|uniref:Sugar isomerase, KpsF/GutQ n=1 Tax=Aspergillus clavatus (strain ATCC 1007 / CBS 513.65 / DSM 816 / NCTC 3887 / NRRL 1 / QM 1276 / 107) TaxID=344612 RepID=A1CTM3_ASPCL|nr:sugar isomerase, KpsF/GutQ [Aspergillus clavatus NRRL 1]EAW06660.1 sugar isomerase, KpsF/GutQ [Aspergillus clavatus NRRL 1]
MMHATSVLNGFSLLPMTPPDPTDALPSMHHDAAAVTTAIHVISTERAALTHLEQIYQTDRLAQENLARAVSQIVRTVRNGGKLVVCGVGKSGKIGQKLEATMNSMGIYSTFLHPTEALHGDLGLIRPHDNLLLISFSGRTPELMLLLPHIPSTVPVIALTSHMHPSTCPILSFHSPDMGILLPAPIHEHEEASFGLSAPTSSTTVALALGDALALASARRFHNTPGRGPAEVFRSFHPGGAIGAASAASAAAVLTPSSMSTVSIPSDYLQSGSTASSEIISFPSASSSSSSSDIPSSHPLIVERMVALDQIPVVSVSTADEVRLLDILLTAIQHPNAKSWVALSPSELIPPKHIRSLSQSSNVDMNISALPALGLPFAVPREHWLCVSSTSTLDEVRRLVSQVGACSRVKVVAVMEDSDPETCVGVVEAEEVWGDREL